MGGCVGRFVRFGFWVGMKVGDLSVGNGLGGV